MKTTRFISAFAALVLGTASFSAWPVYAEDEETMYGDIRYSGALNSELGIYAGDTLDCSKVILEAVMYNWEGKASYVYSFTVGSGEFADLYTLDTSQVDTETPGDYHVVIKPAAGETGSFPDKSISPARYWDLCIKGTEGAIPVKVYPKDINADTPLYLRCYKEYIEMYCGGGVMIPLVGAYPAKAEYEVADETIARVEKSSTAQNLVLWGLKEGEKEARCLYFTRATAPYTRNPEKCPNQDLYYHIGIYVFKAASLQKMVSLPTGVLEKREALEQLRALENGMEVRAMLVDNIKLVKEAPADINTEEDLANALPYIK